LARFRPGLFFFWSRIVAKLSTLARKRLSPKDFAVPKDRKFPLEDKAHIRAAESYERYATPAERKKIDAAARRAFGKKEAR